MPKKEQEKNLNKDPQSQLTVVVKKIIFPPQSMN